MSRVSYMQPMKLGIVPRVIMHDPANDLRQQRVRVSEMSQSR